MSDDTAGPFTRAARLLRKANLNADEANQLIDVIGEMTSMQAARIIQLFESKFEAHADRIDANAKAYDAQLKTMQWFIGIGIALAGVISGVIAALLN